MGEFLAAVMAETIGLFICRVIYCIVGLPVIFIGNIFRGSADKLLYSFDNLFGASANVTLFIFAGSFIVLCCIGIVLGLVSLSGVIMAKTAILLS